MKQQEKRGAITILTDDELDSLPPQSWLIEGILPANSLCAMYGAPGAGKTFLALDWAMRVATGLPFVDRGVTQGEVLLVIAEGVRGLKPRSQSWKDANHTDRVGNLHYVPHAIQLLSRPDVDAFIEALIERGLKPKLVVFDTLARCFEGDENSADAMGRLVSSASRIIEALETTVMLVHHPRKSGDLERGSSALRGAMDAIIAVEEAGQIISIKCGKMKDAAPFDTIRLRRQSYGSSCVLQGTTDAPLTSRATKVAEKRVFLLGLLAETPLTRAEWESRAGFPVTSFARYYESLFDDGRIVVGVDDRIAPSESGWNEVRRTLLRSTTSSSETDQVVDEGVDRVGER